MADYFSQCVVSPMIPLKDITPAEYQILQNIFDSQIEAGELYLYAEIGRHSSIELNVPDIQAALAQTSDTSAATRLLTAAIARLPAGDQSAESELDDEWIEIFQDIVRRSPELTFISVETSFNCSKMRADGFGGAAVVITPGHVDTMSTSQFIDETLAARKRETDDPATRTVLEAGV